MYHSGKRRKVGDENIHWCLHDNGKTIEYALCAKCASPKTICVPSAPKQCRFISKLSGGCYALYHEKIYDEALFFKRGDTLNPTSETSKNGLKFDYIKLHFSRLEQTNENVFTPNSPSPDVLPGFHLTVNSLHRLIGGMDDGWICDEMMEQMITLLNFYAEYDEKGYCWW